MDEELSMRRHSPAGSSSKGRVLRITVPGYRERYGASDFTNSDARSLDDQIARYLCSFMRQLKPGSARKLVIRIKDERKEVEKEEETSKAYHAMFRWRLRMARRALAECIPAVAFLVVTSVFLLWLAHRVEGFDWEEEMAKTSSEVIRLGAWVSGWTAISLLFTQGLDSLRNYFAFWRLLRIPIEFEYRAEKETPKKPQRPTSPTYA